MLGQLSGFLFGGAETTPATTAAAAPEPPPTPCRALPIEDPELDEWVMVAEGVTPAASAAATPACSTTPGTPTSQLTVDDNWTLTPPACFGTSAAALPPASSLENLLIEHPSMSVYVRGRRRSIRSPSLSTAGSPTPEPEPLRRPAEDLTRLEPRRPSLVNVQKLHRRAITQAQKQATQQRRSQRQRSAGQVQRDNRARQVMSAGNGPMRRQHYYTSARHSGANNNRKC